MSARLPLLHKTPFVLDPRPLQEASSPHAGLLAVSRAFRSLGLPDLIAANLQLRKRKRGFAEAQMIESVILLQAIGGECPDDVRLLANDPCLERGLGYRPPKATAVRDFLELFHDEELEALRPAREVQKSFILPSSQPIAALGQVRAGCVRRIAKLFEKQGDTQTIATIDQDATIIESHKRAALPHYEGGRGYQPMIAVWAEADLVVADEFRDGNVPARQAPVECAKLAFAALPATVKTRFFRGDSACHEDGLIQWLRSPERALENAGRILFAISAVMSTALAGAVAKVADEAWKTYDTEADGTLRQWAEIDFVPGEASEKKDSQPLRYVGLRLLKPQGLLFADGSDRKHHAVVTNMEEQQWRGDRLLEWHREKAGTVEHVHDEVKNWLAGGHMPSQHFACNAAWLKMALLTYNIASTIRQMCFEPELRRVRLKKFRLLLIHLMGRMNRNNCVMGLRLCADKEAISRLQAVWKKFELPTQATSFKPLNKGGG